MYFIYVSNDLESIELLEEVLSRVDRTKLLITVANGFDLIGFLQNIKRGEAYPDVIILTTKFLRLSGKELLELLKTDDIYRLIPVVMFLSEESDDDEAFCNRFGAEPILIPTVRKEWISAAKKICAACA